MKSKPNFQTASDFELWYAHNSRVTVEYLHNMGRHGKPCDCGDSECTGWQMAYEDEHLQANMEGT